MPTPPIAPAPPEPVKPFDTPQWAPPPPGKRRGKWLALIAVPVILVLLGFMLLRPDDEPGSTPAPGGGDVPPGRVVFASDRSGNHDVFAADTDGSNVVNLTDAPSRDEPAAASPDGTRVAFRSDRDGTYEIFSIDADGGDATMLTDGEGQNFWPTWSPDGNQIAFTRDRDGGTGIWVMSADGSDARLLVSDVPGHPGYKVLRTPTHARSAFTSDGEAILFEAINGDNVDIFSVGVEGGDVTKLTHDPAPDRTPSMSRDGKLIVFTSSRDDESAMYTMAADGSQVERISGAGSVPSFTPDGDIIFIRNSDVWIMNRDGDDARPLIQHEGNEHAPSWLGD